MTGVYDPLRYGRRGRVCGWGHEGVGYRLVLTGSRGRGKACCRAVVNEVEVQDAGCYRYLYQQSVSIIFFLFIYSSLLFLFRTVMFPVALCQSLLRLLPLTGSFRSSPLSFVLRLRRRFFRFPLYLLFLPAPSPLPSFCVSPYSPAPLCTPHATLRK